MAPFLSSDFLLRNSTARRLYHEHAALLPVIDFHSHINPKTVAANTVFSDITEVWIASDPYKWRAMRMNGIPEYEITGNAPNRKKFNSWAATLPHAIGNPLFHWAGLELKRYFGVDEALTPASADAIWEHCNRLLQKPNCTSQALLEKAQVEVLCTSDDLLDTLDAHRQMRDGPSTVTMLPSLRADSVVDTSAVELAAFCQDLGKLTDIAIDGLEAYKTAVGVRLDIFHSMGCRLADIGLHQPVFEPFKGIDASRVFDELLAGRPVSAQEHCQLKTALLVFLASECHARDWAMQLHIGAQRRTSQRLRDLTGPSGGYACIGRSADIGLVCELLNAMDREHKLPRTILYALNPSDMDMFASVTGSFTGEGIAGKVQFGPAWWFNDNKDGITRQLEALGNMGLLGRHIGMTTDSRSLLSFSRHEYYRRILCNLLGAWTEAGELPEDHRALATLVENICYFNAKNWLRLPTN